MIIEKEDVTVSDTNDNLVETKDGVTCGCGNPSLTMTCRIDGIFYYGYRYNCQCGNIITICHKRNE